MNYDKPTGFIDEPIANPAEMYGRLKEGAHFAGYSFDRACTHLEWLLEEDRWKLGGQYDDVNKFLESIKLDQFRIIAEQRKHIAQLIKELQPAASQRAIAKVIGIDETTVRRDLGTRSAANAATDDKAASEIGGPDGMRAANAAPQIADLSGPDAAQSVGRVSTKNQRSEERRQKRIGRIEEISKDNAPLVEPRRYPIIYADPPWRYECVPGGDHNRSIEEHYPTMELDEICALPVPDIAADDAMLFLWSPAPKLAEALEVVTAWGFTYRTNLTWWKRGRIGVWDYARIEHEHLLVARRGDMPPPSPPERPRSVVTAKPGRNGEKPAEAYAIIERAYPGVSKIELFARRPRDGWAAWENQSNGGP
jgi:N6-adenosine-specific RNA methylase IME4